MLTNKEKSIVPNQDIEWSLKKSRVFAYRKQKTELDKKLQLFEKERRNQMRSISSEMKEMHQFMQDLQVASSFETESRLLFNNYRESENGKQSGRKTAPTYQESHAREDIRVGSLHRVQESTSSYRKLSWPLRRNKAESPSELELKTTELRGGSSGSHSDRSSLYKYRQENISAGQGIDHVEGNSKEKSVQERGNSGSVKIRRLSTPAASNPGSFKGADFSEFTPSRESRDDSPGYKNFVNRPQTGVTTSKENLSRCRIFTESHRISTESRIVDARLSRSRDTRDSQETGVRQKGSESGRSEPIDINQIKNPRKITMKTPSFTETIPLYETSVASQNSPIKLDESVAAKDDALHVAERRAPSQQTIKRELFYKLHGNGSVDNIRVKTTRKKSLRSSYTSSFTETMPVHKTWMATQNSSAMNGNISGKVDTTELENPVAKSTASPRTKKREMNCESRSSVANNSIRTRVKITRVITPSLTETPVTTQNNHVVHQNGAGKTDMAVIGNRTPSPETTNRVLPCGELIDRSQVRGRKTGCSRSFTGPSILVCKESSDTRGVPRNAWTTDASKKTGGGAVLQRRREASARESGSCSPITSSRNFQESWKNRDSPTSRKQSQGSKYKRPLPRNSLPLRYLIRKELKEKRT